MKYLTGMCRVELRNIVVDFKDHASPPPVKSTTRKSNEDFEDIVL